MAKASIRISIVGHGLSAGGGISVGKNFIASMTRVMPEAEYQIFVPAGLGYESCAQNGISVSWQSYQSRYGIIGRWSYDQFFLHRKIEAFAPSLIVCLGNLGVRKNIAPQILLLQDSHYFYPAYHYSRASIEEKLAFYFKRHRFSNDLKRTSVLLCQTRTAMERVRKWYGFNGEMALFPNAISMDSMEGAVNFNDAKPSEYNNGLRLFYLTRYYTHKNLEIFLDLFEKYRVELDSVVVFITISAGHHPRAKTFLRAVRDKGLEKNIINMGPLQQQQIAATFRTMDALVMPSTLESFSGTYLEAMAFGCPILTSDLDFAHDICGDAAIYFNPWSVDALYEAILRLKESPELGVELRNRGRNIFMNKTCSWEQNAQTLRSTVTRLLKLPVQGL